MQRTCRDEVLAAMLRLERRSSHDIFRLQEIASEVESATDAYPSETVRTQVSSVMCANAPVHHANHTNDLQRVDRGHYRLTPSGRAAAAALGTAPTPTRATPTSSEIDIERNLRRYLGDRQPTGRYASFDYCFNYFQSRAESGALAALLRGEALQLSCLHLGFYLASWGMLRGSSALLQRSVRSFIPAIEALVNAPAALWTLDADGYSDDAIATIASFAATLRQSLHAGASDTLVTKVMLGTMGCVPAFDSYFKRGFRVATFGPQALRKVGQFYRENADVIEAHREPTLEFDTGQPSARLYTRAKVVDMVFFIEGMPRG
jgi:hypothetical protein